MILRWAGRKSTTGPLGSRGSVHAVLAMCRNQILVMGLRCNGTSR
jgi:hypothetical protein